MAYFITDIYEFLGQLQDIVKGPVYIDFFRDDSQPIDRFLVDVIWKDEHGMRHSKILRIASQDVYDSRYPHDFIDERIQAVLSAAKRWREQFDADTLPLHREYMFQQMCKSALEWWKENKDTGVKKPDFVTIAKGNIRR